MACRVALTRRLFCNAVTQRSRVVTCAREMREYHLGSLVCKDNQESLRKNPFFEQYKDKLQSVIRLEVDSVEMPYPVWNNFVLTIA